MAEKIVLSKNGWSIVGDKHCYFCQFQFTGAKCLECKAHSNYKKSSAARRIPSTDEKDDENT